MSRTIQRHTKIIALILCLLLITPSYPVIALDPLPGLVGGSDATELAFNTLVDTYFESRTKLNADSISSMLSNVTNQGMLNDELLRLEALQNAQVIEIENSYTIQGYGYHSYEGQATVTETITYTFPTSTTTVTVSHFITCAYIDENDTTLCLTSDEYIEPTINFTSCSYLPYSEPMALFANSNATNDHTNTGDYAYDIIMVAETQIGYIEKATNSNLNDKTGNPAITGTENYTKYGSWYGSNFINAEWCVIFVVWCARQANVASSIIKTSASTSTMKNFFINNDRYYDSEANGGSYIPMVGDVYFQNGHTALVAAVTDTTVTIIEGNAGSLCDRVQSRTLSLTSSKIVGYGNPAYATDPSAHDYESISGSHSLYTTHKCINCGKERAGGLQSDHTTSLVHQCSLCDYSVAATWNCDHSSTMTHTCSICQYPTTAVWMGDHVASLSHTCSVCSHSSTTPAVNSQYAYDSLHHWLTCTVCDDTWSESDHTWVLSPNGGNRCSVCGMTQSSSQIEGIPPEGE